MRVETPGSGPRVVVLARELGAERAVVAGAGHSFPRVGERFNQILADFLARA